MIEVNEGAPLPASLWAATAEPAPHTPPPDRSARFDVAIVGAGYTGLSTALHLAQRGAHVALVDAAEPGWGASGRNGGQVIPGLKYDPDDLVRRYGGAAGERLAEVAGGAADTVFELIERHRIDCDARRAGWIQPAPTAAMLDTVTRRARQWEARGVRVALLDAAQTAARLGTHAYLGSWVDPRAGSVQPLSYARGLARAAQRRGVEIHGKTVARALTHARGEWHIETAHGPVLSAPQVVLATNGYTGSLWPRLARTVIAANSFIVATKPLPPERAAHILPGGEVASDARRLLLYFRRDSQGRLLMGGRGQFAEPRGARDWAHLERSVALLFPGLKDVEYEYRWAGRVALTGDFMPHVHEPAPGLTVALGYNGRGIAMATTMGKLLAARLAHDSTQGPFPFPVTPITPMPLHALQRVYLAAGVAWYRLLDALA